MIELNVTRYNKTALLQDVTLIEWQTENPKSYEFCYPMVRIEHSKCVGSIEIKTDIILYFIQVNLSSQNNLYS